MKKRDRDAGKNEDDLLPDPGEKSGEKLYAGNWICRNVWIKLGLSPEQSKLLTSFSKKFLNPKYQSSSLAAWYLLNAALSHIEIVETLLRSDLEAERRSDPMFAPGGEILWQNKARAKLANWN